MTQNMGMGACGEGENDGGRKGGRMRRSVLVTECVCVIVRRGCECEREGKCRGGEEEDNNECTRQGKHQCDNDMTDLIDTCDFVFCCIIYLIL